jgi:aconitate hydratase/homoaconitate hydratase
MLMLVPRCPMTLTQKVLAQHAIGLDRPWVQAGDVLLVRVDWTIASELAWNGMDKTYVQLGRPKLHDPNRFFLAVDHTVDPETLAKDPRAQKLTELSRDFARQSGIRHFYDANVTILHTKFYRDLVLPGDLVLGADSHTSSHGGMGAFAIGLGGADVTAAMVLGQSWIEVPDAIAVEYRGKPRFGIGGKDIILETLRVLGRNTAAMERTVEYRGDIGSFSTDTRFTIANMTAELGGLNGIFEPDGICADWIARRDESGVKDGARYFRADDDAPYLERHGIDLTKLGPRVARPFAPDNCVPVEEELGRALDGVFIGACTTTEEELILGALVLEQAFRRGQTLLPSTKRLVVPGDLSIQANLARAGLWALYERAGFTVDPPGCSMCLGVASRRAGPGEVWLSSQNRNYKNRMGEGSLAYLASAATVAASSLAMKVQDPRPLLEEIDRDRFAKLCGRDPGPLPEVRVSEPDIQLAAASQAGGATAKATGSVLTGRVQRFGDHVDTDAIIPGQFCHLTSLADLGDKCFHFVRPEFVAKARAGQDIVVAGEAWGSGSSREQAVWALQGAGVHAVIARSFAFIHKRNLVNEALPFLVVEDPEFYAAAQEGSEVTIDFGRGMARVGGREFAAQGASPMVQALSRAGGLVSAIQNHGTEVFTSLTGGVA